MTRKELKEFNEEAVVAVLQEFVDAFPTRGKAAQALGVTRPFLWKVLEGKVRPTESILAKLGFKRERKITYVYIKAVKEEA